MLFIHCKKVYKDKLYSLISQISLYKNIETFYNKNFCLIRIVSIS